jgi:hypothetical protein
LLAAAAVIWLLSHSTLKEALAMGALIAAAGLYYAVRRLRVRIGERPVISPSESG